MVWIASPWLGRSKIRRQLVIMAKPGEVNLMYFAFLLLQNSILPNNKAEVKNPSLFIKYRMTQYQVINYVIHRIHATKTRE